MVIPYISFTEMGKTWEWNSKGYISIRKLAKSETCVLSYVKQITIPGLMHEAGYSGLVHWDDPERWDGEGGGREGQDGEHMYTMAHSFKVISLQ